MKVSMDIFFVVLMILAYVVAPASLIWGWVRWVKRPKLRTVNSILSLMGFLLATASALLAISMVAYAQVHHFGFFDPLLVRIFRWGLLLSMAGFVFGVGGLWRKSTTRWFAPAGAIGTFAFWVLATAGE
jgi:hypothetical protein